MMDIETHTVIYLRDLLATLAASDPQITAFLSCWVYEELWHGEAFSDFLRSYGFEVPAEPKLPDGRTPMPTRLRRTEQLREQLGIGHKLAMLPSMLGSLVMRDFVALHMTWGAINADAPEGRAAVRELDATIAAIPGLHGLTLVGDVLDRALERARRRPGWAGAPPAPPRARLRAATEAWAPAPGWHEEPQAAA